MPSPFRPLRRTSVTALTLVVICALAALVLTKGPIKTARAGNTWEVDLSYRSSSCISDDLRCESLKDAVAAAESGDTIRIRAGRFDAENDILIENKNLTIIGAGQPRTIFLPGGNGSIIDETSGTWITAFNKCPNCSELTSLGRLLRIKNSTVSISGMWITAGGSNGGNGGAVLNEGGTITFSDVKIQGDSEGGDGGAIYNAQGTINLTDCNVLGFTGSFQFSGPIGGSGGGIYNDRGTLNLTRCTVQGNLGHREGSDGANGGGLFNKGGTVNVLDSAFQSSLIGTLEQSSGRVGYTGGRGGGIFNDASGKVTITSTEIRSNTAGQGGTGSDGAGLTVGSGHPGGNGGAGGGIYNEGEMKIVGCTIAGNQTGGGGVGGSSASSPGSGSDGGAGGGIYNVGTMTIENSTVADNATGDGGKGGSGMTDLTGGGNGGRGGNGGGIYTQKNLKMTNVTVTGNKTGAGGAGGSGGALRSNGSAGSSGHGGGVATGSSGPANESVTVKNTIIAANTTATGGSGPDVIGTFISSGHNLVGVVSQDLNDNDELNFTATGDQTGSSSSPLNAKLGPRQHNGGPQTSTYDLLDGSPAINAGDDSVTGAPSNLAYDQRGIGYVRKYNGHVDIGAIEKQPPSNPPVARCLSFNASAQSSCQYIPSASDFDGGSSDPDATDTLTLTLNPSGPLGLGTHSITLIVTDDRGLSSSCVSEVTVVDDVPPQLTVPPGRILFTGPSSTIGGVVVSDLSATLGTATAEDNCSTVTPVRTGVPAGNLFPIGVTTLNYTATDAKGQSTSKTQTVTVVDNTPPKITAPSDRTIYTGAGATLAGVVINNLDGELGTATASDNDSVASVVRSGVPGGNFFPTGMTILTYTARDPSGNATAATQKVTVVDNTAPTINGAAASPSVIWPANNKMVDVLVSYGAGDNSGGTVTTSLSISSNEQTGAGDMLVLDNHRVRLRADRAGKGSGRVYTIVITATDPYGNSSRRIVTVTVPHDQGK